MRNTDLLNHYSTTQLFLKLFRIKETMASETFEFKMHENEKVEVNVLEYQPNFPTSFWIKTILMGIVLVPWRLFLLAITAIAQWLCALFVTYTGHVKGLGFYIMEWMIFVERLSLRYVVGLVVSVEGVKSDHAPIVVVGPHTTFLDGWIITSFVRPRPVGVNADFQRRIPFLGEQ